MRPLAIVICVIVIALQGSVPQARAGNPPDKKLPQGLQLEKIISGKILSYDLKQPAGMAVNSYGELFVVDAGNNRVIKFNSRLQPMREYGGYGSGVGRFRHPSDVYVDRSLNVYVLDSDNRRVVQLDNNLNYVDDIPVVGDSADIVQIFGELSAIVVTPFDEIIVADRDNSRLIMMDAFHNFNKYIGDFSYGRGSLLNPEAMTIDKKGKICVADAGNSRIALFDEYGNYLTEFGEDSLSLPSAIAASPGGILWTGDNDINEIIAFTSDGQPVLSVADAGKEGEPFSSIDGLALSSDNRLFVAESGQNRILVYRIAYEGEQ